MKTKSTLSLLTKDFGWSLTKVSVNLGGKLKGNKIGREDRNYSDWVIFGRWPQC